MAHFFRRSLLWLTLIPALLLIGMIYIHSVDVLHWEEWDILYFMFASYFKGEPLTFQQLWGSSGDHLIPVPRTVAFLAGVLTRVNLSALHLLNALFLSLGFASLLVFVIRNGFPGLSSERRWIRDLFLLSASAYFFCLAPVGVYLWGLSLYIFITVAATVSAFALAVKTERKPLETLALALLILIACLSSINGLLAAFLVALLAALRLREQPCRKRAIEFAAFAALFFILFVLIKSHTGTREYRLFTNGIASFLEYVVIYLGANGNLFDLWQAMIRGLLAVAGYFGICVVVFRSARRGALGTGETYFFLLASFAVGTAFFTAIGRESAHGPAQALSDRYIVFANLYWVGATFFVVKGWLTATNRFLKVFCVCGAVCFFADSFVTSLNKRSFDTFYEYHRDRSAAQRAIRTGDDEKSVKQINPGGYSDLGEKIGFLKEHRLSSFR